MRVDGAVLGCSPPDGPKKPRLDAVITGTNTLTGVLALVLFLTWHVPFLHDMAEVDTFRQQLVGFLLTSSAPGVLRVIWGVLAPVWHKVNIGAAAAVDRWIENAKKAKNARLDASPVEPVGASATPASALSGSAAPESPDAPHTDSDTSEPDGTGGDPTGASE
jgi:hypothetical protein